MAVKVATVEMAMPKNASRLRPSASASFDFSSDIAASDLSAVQHHFIPTPLNQFLYDRAISNELVKLNRVR